MSAGWLDAIGEVGAGRVLADEPLARRTTLRVGGTAEGLLVLEDPERLPAVLLTCRQLGVPWRFLGAGSNVLVTDGRLAGLTIATGGLRELAVSGEVVSAGAGVMLLSLIGFAHRAGLTGMEWAAGIPGTVGGGVVMNAGAQGGDVSDHLLEAQLASADGQIRWVPAQELALRYRHSRLQETDEAVLAGRFRLVRGDVAAAEARLRAVLAHRRATQPQGKNAGSMFKNPPGQSAGRLIEMAGGKGRRLGDAEISPLHANFILNLGQATAQDVLTLADWAKGQVAAAFGQELELEVRVWHADA